MNKMNNLINEFLENSRPIKRDILDIDNKHLKITKNANNNLDKLNSFNFRNWSDQSDMGLKYPMTYISKLFLGVKKNKFFNLFFKVVNKRLSHFFEYSSMADDINVIKSLGGENLLKENPQNNTPGGSNFTLVEGFSVTTRWLRYIYMLSQIQKFKLLKDDEIWVDIGSYYGGLQGLVKKYFPDIRIIMVDFNHQLLRSFLYLKQMYPDANHILPNKISSINNLNEIPKGSILYLEVEDFKKIQKLKINLTTNFFSLGEMKKVVFESYLKSKVIENSDKIYFVNRFSSAPFFEQTYDDQINLFDYKIDKERIYFDIFPISKFLITHRKTLKRIFFRNFSSDYFEIIWKKKSIDN